VASEIDNYANTSSTLSVFDDKHYSSSEIGLDDFTIMKVIGRGSFGKVYLVKKKSDGNFFAMKTLKKDMIIKKG